MNALTPVNERLEFDEAEVRRAREQLVEDGYCLIDGHLPDGTIEYFRKWSDDWLKRTKHSPKWKYQGSDVHVSGTKYRAKWMPNLPQDEAVDYLIEQPVEIMKALAIGDFKAGGAFQIISKPPNAPALYWHQDWARWDDPISLSPWPQQVFLNWYLTDTTRENGCIRVIPGSHRRRLELHDHLVQAHEGGGYDIEETNEWMFLDHPEAIDVPVKTGQLLIGDARLLHSTHPNQSTERRTVLLGWFFRTANDVPVHWQGEVPQEILTRDPDFPMERNRKPGKYLRY